MRVSNTEYHIRLAIFLSAFPLAMLLAWEWPSWELIGQLALGALGTYLFCLLFGKLLGRR